VVGSGPSPCDWARANWWPRALIAGFTLLNIFGLGRTAKVQNVLTSTKLLVIAGFVIFGFLAGTGDWSHFSEPAVRTSTVALPTQFVWEPALVMVGYRRVERGDVHRVGGPAAGAPRYPPPSQPAA